MFVTLTVSYRLIRLMLCRGYLAVLFVCRSWLSSRFRCPQGSQPAHQSAQCRCSPVKFSPHPISAMTTRPRCLTELQRRRKRQVFEGQRCQQQTCELQDVLRSEPERVRCNLLRRRCGLNFLTWLKRFLIDVIGTGQVTGRSSTSRTTLRTENSFQRWGHLAHSGDSQRWTNS